MANPLFAVVWVCVFILIFLHFQLHGIIRHTVTVVGSLVFIAYELAVTWPLYTGQDFAPVGPAIAGLVASGLALLVRRARVRRKWMRAARKKAFIDEAADTIRQNKNVGRRW